MSGALRIAVAVLAPCALGLACLAIAPGAIERGLAESVDTELTALGLGDLAHEVTGRDVHVEVPLTLPGGVDGLRKRLAAIPGVRSVRTRAIGSLRPRQAPEMPFTVQDEIRELKGER